MLQWRSTVLYRTELWASSQVYTIMDIHMSNKDNEEQNRKIDKIYRLIYCIQEVTCSQNNQWIIIKATANVRIRYRIKIDIKRVNSYKSQKILRLEYNMCVCVRGSYLWKVVSVAKFG